MRIKINTKISWPDLNTSRGYTSQNPYNETNCTHKQQPRLCTLSIHSCTIVYVRICTHNTHTHTDRQRHTNFQIQSTIITDPVFAHINISFVCAVCGDLNFIPFGPSLRTTHLMHNRTVVNWAVQLRFRFRLLSRKGK